MRNAVITFLVGFAMMLFGRFIWNRGDPEDTLLRAVFTFIFDMVTLEWSVYTGIFTSYRSLAIFLNLLGFILMLGSALYMIGILKVTGS